MSIDFTCPECNHQFHIPETFAGRKGRCEKCGKMVSIPTIDPADETVFDLEAYEDQGDSGSPPEIASRHHPENSDLSPGLLKHVFVAVGLITVLTIAVVIVINVIQGTLEGREGARLAEVVESAISKADRSANTDQLSSAIQELNHALILLRASALDTSEHQDRLRRTLAIMIPRRQDYDIESAITSATEQAEKFDFDEALAAIDAWRVKMRHWNPSRPQLATRLDKKRQALDLQREDYRRKKAKGYVIFEGALIPAKDKDRIVNDRIRNRLMQENERRERAYDEAGRKEGDTVHVGYTTYRVLQSWWSYNLSDNKFCDQPPNAHYLFVELTVRNDDKKARTVPPLTLIDENGAEYETSSHRFCVEEAIGFLESLNPSVSTQGLIVFDVPRDRNYRLQLSGGYWSTEDAYVHLAPKVSRFAD